MASAIVGSTGFVGSNIVRQSPFDDLYHSKNIHDIAGKTYDLLVCAGAPAAKWVANRDPQGDRDNIQRLIDALRRVRARTVVLISTVDVYPVPAGVDEETAIDGTALHPYGRHRLELEHFLTGAFDTVTVRLPGLFGPGLKKNIVFDLLHNNQVEKIHPDDAFQFYDLDGLWKDVERARRCRLNLVNFATEPTSVREVAREAFGIELDNRVGTAPVSYDVKSRHASLFGGSGGYLYGRDQVLPALKRFVQRERGRQL